MRRALILIIGLTVLTFGLGICTDLHQRAAADRYIGMLHQVRSAVMERRMDDARREQAYVYALWQQDARWLNFLISHHHTRAVNTALLHMTTALEMGWKQDALVALDDAYDALIDVRDGEFATLWNIL